MFISAIRVVSCQKLRNFSTSLKKCIGRRTKVTDILSLDHLLINKLLQSNEKITTDQWISIRKELCQEKQLESISEANVDSIIFDACEAKTTMTSLDYWRFLKEQNIKLNIAVVGKFFKAFYDQKSSQATKEEEAEIFQLYDRMRADYPLFDPVTTERCIYALSLTSRWKEIPDLIKTIEEIETCRPDIYSLMVAAAFNNDDPQLGWIYLKKMLPKMIPNDHAYQSFIQYALRSSKTLRYLELSIERIFQTWRESEIIPFENTVDLFTKVMDDSRVWTATKTLVNMKGRCKNCDHYLAQVSFSQKDFDFLTETFLNNVVVGSDIYNKTTPAEFQRFKEFIETSKPYDVVIDGLNVAYTMSNIIHHTSPAIAVEKVVRALVENEKKVLVLGRKHMNNWLRSSMSYVRSNSRLFLADNMSADDPFMLYAALSGGSTTFIVTRDFLRQHKFLLSDTRLKQVFRRWQMSRQIIPYYLIVGKDWKVNLQYPSTFLMAAQNHGSNWHIPYRSNESTKEMQIVDRPKTWVCLQKINDNTCRHSK